MLEVQKKVNFMQQYVFFRMQVRAKRPKHAKTLIWQMVRYTPRKVRQHPMKDMWLKVVLQVSTFRMPLTHAMASRRSAFHASYTVETDMIIC